MFGRRKTLAEHRALSCPNAGKQSGSVDPKPGKHARATDAVAIGHNASTRPEPKPDQFRTLDAQYQVFAHTRLLVVQALLVQVDRPCTVGDLPTNSGGPST